MSVASTGNSFSSDGETANTASNGPAPIAVYLYAGDQIIENVTTGYFYYQDSLGNTSHVTDSVGNLLERYTYSAFGTPSFFDSISQPLNSSTYGIRHLFQGQLWTQETGLNDYRNRVELPIMDVFLQPDPIGFKGDAANIYRFCNNNAVNRIDPTGLQGVPLMNPSQDYIDGLKSTYLQNQSAGFNEYNNFVSAYNGGLSFLSSTPFRFVFGVGEVAVGLHTFAGGLALVGTRNEHAAGFVMGIGLSEIKDGKHSIDEALDGHGFHNGPPLKPMLATPIDFNFLSVGRSSPILFGKGASTGRALYNAGGGWLPAGRAPADIRWAQNSGTGNWTADQTAKAIELAGGLAPNAGEGFHPVSFNLR